MLLKSARRRNASKLLKKKLKLKKIIKILRNKKITETFLSTYPKSLRITRILERKRLDKHLPESNINNI